MADKDELGRAGEDLAARFLERTGYHILARNWRGTRGELDIIAEHDGTVVFVEVKTRSTTGFLHPFEAVTPRKVARLRRLAGEWCRTTDAVHGPLRIDVVAVVGGLNGPARIEHLRGVS